MTVLFSRCVLVVMVLGGAMLGGPSAGAQDNRQFEAADDAQYAPRAPNSGEGVEVSLRNSMGRFVFDGDSATASYEWYDGTEHDDDLTFVRYSRINGMDVNGDDQVHRGSVYKVDGARFWIFVSLTPLGQRNGRTIYPLYYSFEGSRSGFRRWTSASGTYKRRAASDDDEA